MVVGDSIWVSGDFSRTIQTIRMGKRHTMSDPDEIRFLKEKLERAVASEEYEYAAVIHSRIKELQDRIQKKLSSRLRNAGTINGI